MQLLLDTNVLVSALIKEGKSRKTLERIIAGQHTLIISRHLIEEFSGVVGENRIRKYVTAEEATRFLRLVTSIAVIVDPKSRGNLMKTSDDLILSAAYDGLADTIVTGDKDLLALGSFRGIKIVSVSAAIDLLSSSKTH